MRYTTILALALLLLACVGGCRVLTLGDGEAGFKQSTSFSFYHHAAKTADEKSSLELEVAEQILGALKPPEKPAEPRLLDEEPKTEEGGD